MSIKYNLQIPSNFVQNSDILESEDAFLVQGDDSYAVDESEAQPQPQYVLINNSLYQVSGLNITSVQDSNFLIESTENGEINESDIASIQNAECDNIYAVACEENEMFTEENQEEDGQQFAFDASNLEEATHEELDENQVNDSHIYIKQENVQHDEGEAGEESTAANGENEYQFFQEELFDSKEILRDSLTNDVTQLMNKKYIVLKEDCDKLNEHYIIEDASNYMDENEHNNYEYEMQDGNEMVESVEEEEEEEEEMVLKGFSSDEEITLESDYENMDSPISGDILQTSIDEEEKEEEDPDMLKIAFDKRFYKGKFATEIRQLHNFISSTKIIEAPVRQARMPRKQKIQPLERSGEEIVVQEVVVSSNGFIETRENGVVTDRKRLVPSETIQLSDTDDEEQDRKKIKRRKISAITISDSDNEENEPQRCNEIVCS